MPATKRSAPNSPKKRTVSARQKAAAKRQVDKLARQHNQMIAKMMHAAAHDPQYEALRQGGYMDADGGALYRLLQNLKVPPGGIAITENVDRMLADVRGFDEALLAAGDAEARRAAARLLSHAGGGHTSKRTVRTAHLADKRYAAFKKLLAKAPSSKPQKAKAIHAKVTELIEELERVFDTPHSLGGGGDRLTWLQITGIYLYVLVVCAILVSITVSLVYAIQVFVILRIADRKLSENSDVRRAFFLNALWGGILLTIFTSLAFTSVILKLSSGEAE